MFCETSLSTTHISVLTLTLILILPSFSSATASGQSNSNRQQAVLSAHDDHSHDDYTPFSAQLYPSTSNLSDIDIVYGSQFAGLTTFAHLPYFNCYVESERDIARPERQKQLNNGNDDGGSDGNGKDNGPGLGFVSPPAYDIAFIGAPFDTGVSSRPGARFGPTGIRRGSERIAADFAWDLIRETNPFKSWAQIIDCGDVPMTVFDNRYALKQLEKAYRIVSGRPTADSTKTDVDHGVGSPSSNEEGRTPRIVMLGGDHTVTLAALRAAYDKWGKMQVIHFDSHIDTWDPTQLGGAISDYSMVNHGTFLHVAHEEGLIGNRSIHAGIRAPGSRPRGDKRNDMRCGFEIVTAQSIDRIGVQGIVQQLRDRVGNDPVYISVDIDVLDPAFAPATGTPEVGGWTTRELLSILEGLSGLRLIGADVVEVAPIYDTAGETTALAAAQVALTLMSLMVDKRI